MDPNDFSSEKLRQLVFVPVAAGTENTVSFVTTLTDGTLPHISGTCPRVTPCQVYLHSAVNWYNNGSLEYTPKKSDCTVLS